MDVNVVVFVEVVMGVVNNIVVEMEVVLVAKVEVIFVKLEVVVKGFEVEVEVDKVVKTVELIGVVAFFE